jgi:hypothetical protein
MVEQACGGQRLESSLNAVIRLWIFADLSSFAQTELDFNAPKLLASE